MNKQFKADMALLIVVMAWGGSYYMTDSALKETTTLTLNAIRFLGAFFIAALLSIKRLKGVSRATLKYSMIIGSALCGTYICFTLGVQNTSLSNSAFLCALPVIFVPIFQFLFLRKKLEKRIVIAVIMSLIGIMLLTLKDDFSINRANLKGDIICIFCAIFYAVDLLMTERAVKAPDVNAFHLGVFQLGVTGILMLMGSFILERPYVLPHTPKVWGFIIFLTIFCTGIPFVVQSLAQQYTTASHVGIIFTLEPVFAAIVAYFIAGEVLSLKSYMGAAIMLLALFMTEIDPARLLQAGGKSDKRQS